MSDVKVSLIPPSSLKPSQELTCLWDKCYRTFDDPELLYHHLANDHVGRKSTGNLCLNCHWEKCETVTTKRDHITSHLRVHVPLKPHVCDTCKKAFKRPQDLKKHEKIHTEEHQAQISMLKNERMNRNAQAPTPPHYPRSDQSSPADSTASSPLPGPLSPPNAISNGSDHVVPTVYSSPYSQYSDSFSTPTPDQSAFDLNTESRLESYSLNNKRGYHQLSDITSNGVSNKRGAETLEDFCWDVKKQRIAPVYNQEMSDRLSQLTFFLGENDHFNLPAAIRNKQDLQQFNSFLSDLNSQYGGEFLDPNVFEDSTTGLFDFGLSSITQYPNVATMALPTDSGFTVSDSLYPDLSPVVAGTTEDLYDFLPPVPTLQTPESIYPTIPPTPPEEKIYSHDGTFCTGDDNLYVSKPTHEFVGDQDVFKIQMIKAQLTTKCPDDENDKTEVKPIEQAPLLNTRFGKTGLNLLKLGSLPSLNPEKDNISIKHEESDGVDSLSNQMANIGIKDVPDSKKPDKQIAADMNPDQKRKCAELIAALFKKVNQMYRESSGPEEQSFVKVERKDVYVSTEN